VGWVELGGADGDKFVNFVSSVVDWTVESFYGILAGILLVWLFGWLVAGVLVFSTMLFGGIKNA